MGNTIKEYKGREALIAMVNGMKLRRSYWLEHDHIKMTKNGRIENDSVPPYIFNDDVEYIEYKEPKKKQKYYKHHYKQKGSPLSDIKSTDWVMSLHYMDYYEDCELVATDEREF